MTRSVLTAASEVAGIGAIAAGCWLIWPPVALIVVGVGLIVLGVVNG